MKILLQNNSIVYRLDAADIEKIKTTGKVEEHTWIGAHPLHFCIRSREQFVVPAIKLEGTGVYLGVPSDYLLQLTDTELREMSFELANPDGSKLHIAVEKEIMQPATGR